MLHVACLCMNLIRILNNSLFFFLLLLQIHDSWLFFPWHRAYLLFYERILGRLLNDTSFALPFWHWDSPSSMSIPPLFRNSSSPLFNPSRHPPALKFLDLGGCSTPQCNLQLINRQFSASFDSPLLFFGSPYRAGDSLPRGGGSLESAPHGPVHMSTGDDMSFIATAARDPIFFAHHANVDRLWAIWEGMNPKNVSKVFGSRDFLDASFLFWDEDMQLVRIFVRDVVDVKKLGFVYEGVEVEWMGVKGVVEEQGIRVAVADGERFPLVLREEVSFEVVGKGGRVEVSGIEFDGRDYVWFDVWVGRVGGGRVEAGCFVHLGRKGGERIGMVRKLHVGIKQFVEDVGAGGDESLVVSLVPRVGGGKVVVGGVAIV